jgi:nitrate reductase assembly molybdenum cofactor insertion protein NarJ
VNAPSVALAAQADLVLLTVEMLGSPQALSQSQQAPWFEIPEQQISELLLTAFPSAEFPMHGDASNPSLRSALLDVHRCAGESDVDAWSDEFCRMFDGSTACPLNQAAYVRRDKGAIIGDLCGFYLAFGFQAGSTHGERPDQLCSQLEFLAMLLALASRAPDAMSHQVVSDALAQYARVHMHDWLPAVCWQMCESAEIEYYGATAQWLRMLWDSLSEIHDWPMDQVADQHLEPAAEPDNPFECGAPDLHQIQVNEAT